MAEPKEPIDPDELEKFSDHVTEVYEGLYGLITDFADEHDVPYDAVAELLLSIAISLRSLEYVMSVAKPSGGGLRRELDRFSRHVQDVFRDRKKDADEMVAAAKEDLDQPGEKGAPDGS
jgi:hypothetical protein